MQIHFLTVGTKMPSWVQQGYEEYAKRLPRECELILKEIPAGKRTKNSDTTRIMREEGERILAAIPSNCHVVTLDLGGKLWSTRQLAHSLERWQGNGQHVALIVGGADGIDDAVKYIAKESWCLSNLTFPHPLVRIVVAEQIYRAWSILQHHPYHR
jgi:23S rRNA (pseudouridine1915-N3)-methyltransferase